MLENDCESLLGSLKDGPGFWNLSHWNIDDSQNWIPLKGNGTCHFAVTFNGSQIANGDDTTVYLSYGDVSSVLLTMVTTGRLENGTSDSGPRQIYGAWPSCQPNDLTVQWAFYNPIV
ncbi:hypothetical protein VMCG_06569 [Cytospora schulzeri]|uniref:Ecp2 effector protein domain-containing protein n=1 Tax=Cytospora schulzeri TaxID=448051 RepID=A0A423WBU9_9PEZI|nr:hypothetical protein VMCG_06569 [Valsa malicola]